MTYVVAEIGVNWDGNFVLAKEMMENAKNAGCNAVKFQAFNEMIVREHPEKDRLLLSSLSNIDTINKISDIADSVGIEWFATPMFPEAVELLEPFVTKYKIREFDGRQLLQNKTTELLERVLETKKEIFVSSQTTPKNSKFFKNYKIKWLYCVPKYPCNLDDLNFTNINDFDGYSNHCTDMLAPLSATILGAQVIEVHITSSKKKNFVDNSVSFDYDELQYLVNLIRRAERIKRTIQKQY